MHNLKRQGLRIIWRDKNHAYFTWSSWMTWVSSKRMTLQRMHLRFFLFLTLDPKHNMLTIYSIWDTLPWITNDKRWSDVADGALRREMWVLLCCKCCLQSLHLSRLLPHKLVEEGMSDAFSAGVQLKATTDGNNWNFCSSLGCTSCTWSTCRLSMRLSLETSFLTFVSDWTWLCRKDFQSNRLLETEEDQVGGETSCRDFKRLKPVLLRQNKTKSFFIWKDHQFTTCNFPFAKNSQSNLFATESNHNLIEKGFRNCSSSIIWREMQ